METRREFMVRRESEMVYVVETKCAFWSDGSVLRARLARAADGTFSNVLAQAIDRKIGLRYFLVSPVAFRHTHPVAQAAESLRIGDAAVFTVLAN